MSTKKFRFDASKTNLIQESLEKLSNSTLQDLAGDHVNGGEWSLSAFLRSDPDKKEEASN